MVSNQKLQCERSLKDQAPWLWQAVIIILLLTARATFLEACFTCIITDLAMKLHNTNIILSLLHDLKKVNWKLNF